MCRQHTVVAFTITPALVCWLAHDALLVALSTIRGGVTVYSLRGLRGDGRKMKYRSSTIVDGRGSIAGTTFSRNRFGLYQRARVAPIQPRTPSQVNNRSLFAAVSRSWNNVLSATQRTNWNAAAASATFFDSLGQPYNPSGKQLYQAAMTNAIQGGLCTVPTSSSSPYTIATIPFTQPAAITGFAIAPIAGPPAAVLGMSWTDPIGTAQEVLVYATPPQSPGVSFLRSSLFKFLGHTLANATQPLSIDALYTGVYTALPASGKRVGIQVRIVDHNSGYASPNAMQLYLVP